MDEVSKNCRSLNCCKKEMDCCNGKQGCRGVGEDKIHADHPVGCIYPETNCDCMETGNRSWPLKIYVLSRFNIVRNGKTIEFSGKVQQKPLAMLKVLIALGGRNIRVGRIIDLVWPEMESETSHQSFKITLYRLRRLLSHDQVIQFRDGCLSIDQNFCWVDIWEFERMVVRIDALRFANDRDLAPEEMGRLTARALSLYSGNFLVDSGLPWALSTRERLRSKFVRLVVNSGCYWEQSGAWYKAAECYQKGLEIDDLVEEFYQRLLACYRHLGKRGEALILYNHCRSVLAMLLTGMQK